MASQPVVQIKLLNAFVPFYSEHKRYKFTWGGRGSGKSVSISLLLLELAREKYLRILCAREIQKSIKESVHTTLKDKINEYGFLDYDIKENEIINKITGSMFIFCGLRDHTVESIKSYEGIDICWIEEAQTITNKSLNILTPTIRKKGSELWFSYNRKTDLDPVHVLCNRELETNELKKCYYNDKEYKWIHWVGKDALGININYDGNFYFTQELSKEMEKDKEDNYDLYLHKWLGEPENQADYALINRKLVLSAVNRNIEQNLGGYEIGVDPARFGDDSSVICYRAGYIIQPFISFNGIDTVKLVNEVLNLVAKIRKTNDMLIPIKIDDTGIGGGVTDQLRLQAKEYNIEIIPVNFGGKSTNKKYENYGTEIWCNMKEMLETISIPDDSILINQLITRRYEIKLDQRIKLTSKQEMKKKGYSSPDRADALALCLANKKNMKFEDVQDLSRKPIVSGILNMKF